MRIGYIGLGKMGINMVDLLLKKKHSVVAFDLDKRARARARRKGAKVVSSLRELVAALKRPRIIWVMVPHAVVGSVLGEIEKYLQRGDFVIDGGNSPYAYSVRRAKKLGKKGIHFMDVGVSGGPRGAREGACLMIGGEKQDYTRLRKLFRDIAAPSAERYVGRHGAGHFVKMVHNGIEYGMMQAIAEGFAVMKKSPYKLDLEAVADVYNHRSVIESRLIGWLHRAYKQYRASLKGISGKVAHSGEGLWTVRAAEKLGVPVDNIKQALLFRIKSQKKPSYAGKVLTALRNQFGGHSKKGNA